MTNAVLPRQSSPIFATAYRGDDRQSTGQRDRYRRAAWPRHCDRAGRCRCCCRSRADRDAPGLGLRGYPLIDGGRAAELTLNGVTLGTDALLGRQGEAFVAVERCVGHGILALCAEALGAMDAAKTATLEYLQTRRQFGVAIGSFQALQHRMADMLLEIEHHHLARFIALGKESMQ